MPHHSALALVVQQMLLEYGRKVLGLTRFVAKIGASNSASLALFEQPPLSFVRTEYVECFDEVHLLRVFPVWSPATAFPASAPASAAPATAAAPNSASASASVASPASAATGSTTVPTTTTAPAPVSSNPVSAENQPLQPAAAASNAAPSIATAKK